MNDDFAGKWQTTFGPMDLTQEGKRVRGTYLYLGSESSIEGELTGGRLVFTYREPTVSGEGWFELARYGKAFQGAFRPETGDRWGPWHGERIGFDGLWNSTFGLMRLIEEADKVRGVYEAGGSSTISGKRKGNQLVFTYREPNIRGEGRFELSADGLSFQGEWKPQSESAWRPWSGIRVRPQPGLTWLVVLEAPWQRFLSDREYSFGNMLREFFARIPNVQVRHRFFANEAGLQKCCRDLQYMAEPVVLVVATHAKPEGISVDGQTIGPRVLVEALQDAVGLQLVHFSACLLMQDPATVDILKAFCNETRVPISGYKTSVDWAASAIIEFTYLDLILARGMAPADAARALLKLLPFAGSDPVPDTPFHPADFALVLPEVKAEEAAPPERRRKARR
jgi:hypothetical protein